METAGDIETVLAEALMEGGCAAAVLGMAAAHGNAGLIASRTY
jgi:hypothetical protein